MSVPQTKAELLSAIDKKSITYKSNIPTETVIED